MYVDTLTVTAMIVVLVALVVFIVCCVIHNCGGPCVDKSLCGDEVHEGERSWPL